MRNGSALLFGLFVCVVAAGAFLLVYPGHFSKNFSTFTPESASESMKKPIWIVRFAVFESEVFSLQNGAGSPAGIGYVMEMGSDSSLKVLEIYPATFGSRKGMKEKEGDRKSPHGRYYIVRQRTNLANLNIFGGAFLDLNYPNDDDLAKERTGTEIGIHGGRMLPTRGCIRILDDDWKPGVENIKAFAALTGMESAVLITKKLHPALKGNQGKQLSAQAWKTYYGLLKAETVSREAVLEKLGKY